MMALPRPYRTSTPGGLQNIPLPVYCGLVEVADTVISWLAITRSLFLCGVGRTHTNRLCACYEDRHVIPLIEYPDTG